MTSADAEPHAVLEVLSFSTSIRIPADPAHSRHRTFWWDNAQPGTSITATADSRLAAMGYQRTGDWAPRRDMPAHEIGTRMCEYTATVTRLP